MFKPYQKLIFYNSFIFTIYSYSSDVINSESFKCSVFYNRDTPIQLGFSWWSFLISPFNISLLLKPLLEAILWNSQVSPILLFYLSWYICYTMPYILCQRLCMILKTTVLQTQDLRAGQVSKSLYWVNTRELDWVSSTEYQSYIPH